MDKNKIIVGLDLGLEGGICIRAGSIDYYPMPVIGNQVDYQTLMNLLPKENVHIVLEDLRSLYAVSTASTWSLASQSGAIEGILTALKLPFTKVAPKDWQKEMFQGIPPIRKTNGRADTKKMALIAAKRLFPTFTFLATERSRVPHNGIVDAVLLAEWGWRNIKQVTK